MNQRYVISLVLACMLTICIIPGISTAEVKFITKWGSYGSGDGQFANPTAIAINPNTGVVYVTDCNNYRIQYFDENGKYLGKWGEYGSGDGKFKEATGIAYNPIGDTLYVTDFVNQCIQYFDLKGTFKGRWSTGGEGTLGPTRIATGHNDNLYITNWKNNRVQCYDAKGVLLSEWGDFQMPYGIAVDGNNLNVYVADTIHKRTQFFTSQGKFLGEWAGPYPYGIAVDQDETVYECYYRDSYITYRNSTGGIIGQWGSEGSGDGQFHSPSSIAVNPRNNRIYVVDAGNNRIQVFSRSNSLLNPDTLAITGISPSSGVNSGVVSVSLTGTGFSSNADIHLIKNGESNITATSVVIQSSTKITCDFPITGKKEGTWDVVLESGTMSTTLPAGFTITRNLVTPSITRITPVAGNSGMDTKITITGNNFMPGVTVQMIKGLSTRTATIIKQTDTSIICSLPTKGADTGLWNLRIKNPESPGRYLNAAFTVV